ncbi:unnamed protein product [Schistosoma margrebowiei]|uniref:Uncharacterized protein n=1 Tax=Schistosoma margrebowiei TaxID=48269 RepID=A0A183M9E2_9TREM|nr:unnamed protein product [Schistosoma margrebowiei]
MNRTSQTETFVMDCSRSIISAVELTHSTAHIAPCSFHVCRAMCKKTRNPIIKQYLCQLVRDQTVAKFNQTRRIISVRSRRIAAYLNKNWMNKKETWAAAFNSNVVTLGNNTNNWVESAHRQLKRNLSNRDALSKFDLVLKLCCRWTWQAVHYVDGNITAISSPDYNETNRLYRTLRSKIHTLSTLFGQTTAQDTLTQLIDQVDELIRMRLLATVSEHGKSTGTLETKI